MSRFKVNPVKAAGTAACSGFQKIIKELAQANSFTFAGQCKALGLTDTERRHLIAGTLAIEIQCSLALALADLHPRLIELSRVVPLLAECLASVGRVAGRFKMNQKRDLSREGVHWTHREGRWRFIDRYGDDARMLDEHFLHQSSLAQYRVLLTHPRDDDPRFPGYRGLRDARVCFSFLQGIIATARQPTRWRNLAHKYFDSVQGETSASQRIARSFEKEIGVLAPQFKELRGAAEYLSMRMENRYYQPVDDGRIVGARGLEAVLWLLLNEPVLLTYYFDQVHELHIDIAESKAPPHRR